jgi:hypothetical protein
MLRHGCNTVCINQSKSSRALLEAMLVPNVGNNLGQRLFLSVNDYMNKGGSRMHPLRPATNNLAMLLNVGTRGPCE